MSDKHIPLPPDFMKECCLYISIIVTIGIFQDASSEEDNFNSVIAQYSSEVSQPFELNLFLIRQHSRDFVVESS